jgi:hypothetical protein
LGVTVAKKKGIVDPWRVVNKLHPPPKPTPAANKRVNIEDRDIDSDLKRPSVNYLTCVHGSIEVKGDGINTQNLALVQLVGCLFKVLEEDDGLDFFESRKISFVLDTREWSTSHKDINFSSIETTEDFWPRTAILFWGQSLDQGMLKLIRALNVIGKRPGGIDLLRKWGIKTSLR